MSILNSFLPVTVFLAVPALVVGRGASSASSLLYRNVTKNLSTVITSVLNYQSLAVEVLAVHSVNGISGIVVVFELLFYLFKIHNFKD